MNSIQWKSLTTSEDLEQAVAESLKRNVVLFKHSTRCSVSFMAKKTLELNWNLNPAKTSIYFLDLIRHRDISNIIAQKFNIAHESPQLILLKNEKVVYHASRNEISVDELQTQLA